jgi:hypothetical protein
MFHERAKVETKDHRIFEKDVLVKMNLFAAAAILLAAAGASAQESSEASMTTFTSNRTRRKLLLPLVHSCWPGQHSFHTASTQSGL